MAYTLIDQFCVGSSDGNGFTTADKDTTGAHLIRVSLASYEANAAPTVADNMGNSPTALTARSAFGQVRIQTFYFESPTVGAGHHWIVSGASSFAAIHVSWWAEAPGATYEGHENGANGTTAHPWQPGSITPDVDDCLITTTTAFSGVSDKSIDSGFTYTMTEGVDLVANVGGQCFGIDFAYKIQTSAAAVNPSWDSTTNPLAWAVDIQSFAPAIVGGGSPPPAGAGPLLSSRIHRLVRDW